MLDELHVTLPIHVAGPANRLTLRRTRFGGVTGLEDPPGLYHFFSSSSSFLCKDVTITMVDQYGGFSITSIYHTILRRPTVIHSM